MNKFYFAGKMTGRWLPITLVFNPWIELLRKLVLMLIYAFLPIWINQILTLLMIHNYRQEWIRQQEQQQEEQQQQESPENEDPEENPDHPHEM